MHHPSLEKRLAHVQCDLAGRADAALLDQRVSTWVISSDRNLPKAFLRRSVREVLALSFDRIANTYGLRRLQIQKLIELLERASKQPPTPSERFTHVRSNLNRIGDPGLLDKPLSTWVISSDRHLPQAFLRRSLREFLTLTYEQLAATTGVGIGRIEKLIDVLERICVQPPLQSDSIPERQRPLALTARRRQSSCRAPWRILRSLSGSPGVRQYERHRLEQEHLGRFARSLSDVPQGLWSVPLSEYADKPLYEVRSMSGYGPARIGQVLDVFYQIAQTIVHCPTEVTLAIRLLPPLVRDAVLWAEGVLRDGSAPNVRSIREGFLVPLFAFLETDLGTETTVMIRRRIGLDGPAENIEQVASDVGLTRERVRQITAKAAQVIRVRWPEGKFILDNVYALLQASPEAEAQLDLMHMVLDACFALEVTRSVPRSDVLAAWDRAGRAKRTPMSEAAVRTWASDEFPDLPSDVIRQWLEEEGLRHVEPSGTALFFSNDPLDKLLLHLYTHPEPMPVGELPDFVEGDERNLRLRVERDPRFIEDEFKRVLPAELGAFFRREGRWFIRLEPVQDAHQRAESVALSDIIHMVVGGLVQAGVCDATVWGVHRITCSLLTRVYGSALSPSVTPFVLASTLTRHSDGLVRHMRRRRLRWDSANGSIPVRGKRGWVDHLATVAGVPMTLDELDAALRRSFQDYESYVLQQLNLDEDEEGAGSYGCRFVSGVSHVVPGILIPRGWELDLATGNISEGVRLVVAKIVSMSTRRLSRRITCAVSLGWSASAITPLSGKCDGKSGRSRLRRRCPRRNRPANR